MVDSFKKIKLLFMQSSINPLAEIKLKNEKSTTVKSTHTFLCVVNGFNGELAK